MMNECTSANCICISPLRVDRVSTYLVAATSHYCQMSMHVSDLSPLMYVHLSMQRLVNMKSATIMNVIAFDDDLRS
jgi:hypothetical protein